MRVKKEDLDRQTIERCIRNIKMEIMQLRAIARKGPERYKFTPDRYKRRLAQLGHLEGNVLPEYEAALAQCVAPDAPVGAN